MRLRRLPRPLSKQHSIRMGRQTLPDWTFTSQETPSLTRHDGLDIEEGTGFDNDRHHCSQRQAFALQEVNGRWMPQWLSCVSIR